MRAVVQRVSKAAVNVDGECVSSIGRGLCVLVGIDANDKERDSDWMAAKLINLRVFPDASDRRWGANVRDLGMEVLCVSQFTLYSELKGHKPVFGRAMAGPPAKEFYEAFLAKLGQQYDPAKIKDGVFGAMMDVDITNDGPVTVILDSPPVPQSETDKASKKKEEELRRKSNK